MIRYALICEHEHEFEGWFGSSADYDDQQSRGLVDCPVCGAHGVSKQIMAPAVAGTKRKGRDVPAGKMRAMMMEAAGRIRRHVEENFDHVGDAFAKEARAIHEGKSEERPIYGQATPKEVKALVEDGVPIAPLPPEPPKKTDLN
jgi:hypothetical protein